MRAYLIVAMSTSCVLALGSAGTEACGDKFVRVGRGGRFQRGYVAVHPASILVYVNKGSKASGSMKDLEPALKAAGHKARAVNTPAGFAEALRDGRYDVILTELADLPALEPQIRLAPAKPAILPVLHNGTKAQVGAAEKEHSCVVQDARKKYDVLVDIDQVMESRR